LPPVNEGYASHFLWGTSVFPKDMDFFNGIAPIITGSGWLKELEKVSRVIHFG